MPYEVKIDKSEKVESDDEADETKNQIIHVTKNEETQETETSENQPERRVTRSMTRSNLTSNDNIRENTRVTRSMSRENEALAPNINNIIEFAMVGGTDVS